MPYLLQRYAVASEMLQEMIRINPSYITNQDKVQLILWMFVGSGEGGGGIPRDFPLIYT